SVVGTEREDLENQQVERSLQQISLWHRFLSEDERKCKTVSPRRSRGERAGWTSASPAAPRSVASERRPGDGSWRKRICSGGPPRPAQRLPTNQRTAEREKRSVDVGPLVVADTEASKLIEPGKCPLDDPAPSSQTAAVLGAAHRQQRQDAASSQPGSDCLCIV